MLSAGLVSLFKIEGNINFLHYLYWGTNKISLINNDTSMEFYCKKGILKINDNSDNVITYRDKNLVIGSDDKYSYKINNITNGPFKNIFEHFLFSIRNKKLDKKAINDTVKVIKICEAMKRSSLTNKTVNIKN